MNSSFVPLMRRSALRLFPALLICGLIASGCAHYPVNAPLTALDAQTGYRFSTAVCHTNSDDLLLILAFSGGGMRAAALSYGVLQELSNTTVGRPENQHRLLDDAGMISSVSGGSFTAAYYTLWGDRIFSDFEPRFLKKHAQTGLLFRTLAPWNQVRLFSPTFNRSDLAAEYYDHLLFHGATFGDLTPKPGRPFLIMNATDLAIGARFEFTQDEFDLLGSDLSSFPISRAVAASSAFPVLLSPVIVKNYSAERAVQEPEIIQSVLCDPTASSRMKNLALQAHSYFDGHRRKYIHLLDGGLTDNLGLRAPAERALEREQFGMMPGDANVLPPRVAVIIVDANTENDFDGDSKERPLGLGALVNSVTQVIVSRYSFETIELFREISTHVAQERTTIHTLAGNVPSAGIEFYIVELHFSQLADDADRSFFNSVPTKLQLPSSSIDRLKLLAREELRNNPEFRRLMQDLQHRTSGRLLVKAPDPDRRWSRHNPMATERTLKIPSSEITFPAMQTTSETRDE